MEERRKNGKKGSVKGWAARMKPCKYDIGAKGLRLKPQGNSLPRRGRMWVTDDGSCSPPTNRKPNKVPRAGSLILTLTSTTANNIQSISKTTN